MARDFFDMPGATLILGMIIFAALFAAIGIICGVGYFIKFIVNRYKNNSKTKNKNNIELEPA